MTSTAQKTDLLRQCVKNHSKTGFPGFSVLLLPYYLGWAQKLVSLSLCSRKKIPDNTYAVDADDDRRSRVHGPVRDATLNKPAPHCTINNAAKPLHNLSSDDGVGRASTSRHAMFDAHIVTDAADQSSAPISKPLTG